MKTTEVLAIVGGHVNEELLMDVDMCYWTAISNSAQRFVKFYE